MTKIDKLFPKGNKETFMLSWDHGVTQDRCFKGLGLLGNLL